MNKRGQELMFALFFIVALALAVAMLFAMVSFQGSLVVEQEAFDQFASQHQFEQEYLAAVLQTSADYALQNATGADDFIAAFEEAFERIVAERDQGISDSQFFTRVANGQYEVTSSGDGYLVTIDPVDVTTRVGAHVASQERIFQARVSL